MEVHAYIGVLELQRGIEFYTRGLGLRLHRRLGNTWVELAGASVPIFLLVVSDRPHGFSGPWTMHLDFLTDHLEAATQQAQDAGAVLLRPVQERAWGRMANLTDPFGNHFDLIELAPGGYDRIAQASDAEAGTASRDRGQYCCSPSTGGACRLSPTDGTTHADTSINIRRVSQAHTWRAIACDAWSKTSRTRTRVSPTTSSTDAVARSSRRQHPSEGVLVVTLAGAALVSSCRRFWV